MPNPSFLVHEAAVHDSPATHAFVIGVGNYPHLNGGLPGQRTEDHGGMGQLTSPPVSARAFASWLIKSFKHPGKPLATVSLLLSEQQPGPFIDPLDNTKQTPVEVANSVNVHQAGEAWINRGNRGADNLLIFYFCGHGIAAGTDTALLLADYGAKELDSLEGAIDFRRFRLGMNRCKASEQCFFVDACRTESDTLIQANAAGRYIIKPGSRGADWPIRKAPVFYSTMNGYKAYGLPDQPSIYTDALLKALQNLAADDATGDWRISTDRLQAAVNHIVEKRKLDIATLVPPTGDDVASIDINYLNGPPSVPVYVNSDPPQALGDASLFYQFAGGERMPAAPEGRNGTEWTLQLPAGNYEFTARFPSDQQATISNYVKPVYRIVTLKVPQ